MLSWLSNYAAGWNPKNDYSIAAPGSLGRVFNGQGRLVHPQEMAAMVSASPNFVGKKRKSVWLGISDSEAGGDRSYANRLSALLNTKVRGCSDDAYLGPNELMMCGNRPVFDSPAGSNTGRDMPIGFALGSSDFLMLFCNQRRTGIDPRVMLSPRVAYGLYDDEVASLEAQAATESEAAFRLYQYHWIARRDRSSALRWLERAAGLGHSIARYNLAYELFESRNEPDRKRAEVLVEELNAAGFPATNLRTYFPAH